MLWMSANRQDLVMWPNSLHARFLENQVLSHLRWIIEQHHHTFLPIHVCIHTHGYAPSLPPSIYLSIYLSIFCMHGRTGTQCHPFLSSIYSVCLHLLCWLRPLVSASRP